MLFGAHEIYTVQLARANYARKHGIRVVDITVKSGMKAFAPTWDMVMSYKNGELSEENYTRQYYKLMDHTYQRYGGQWDHVLSLPQVALACYCSPNAFCHRHLLADMLVKIHEDVGRSVALQGELTK